METETIASRNVVDLLLQEQFNASICKPSADTDPAEDAPAPKAEPADFVLGWDC